MTAAPFILTDCTAWLAGLSMTTYSNELSVKESVDDLETTCFGNAGYRSRIGGLKTIEAELKGLWDSALDVPGVTNLAVVDQVATFTAAGVEAQPAWFFQAGTFSWERFGKVGDLDEFSMPLMGTNTVGLVTGQLAKAKGNVSATGAIGTGLTGLSSNSQVSATQYLYAAVHVFSAGTSMTLKIQSDDNVGFASPTDRITLSAITATGGTWVTRLAGPITDTYYRFNVSAITGTFNMAAAIGIAT